MATHIECEVKAIGFVDCCGFSSYTETHGDRAGVRAYLVVRRAIERQATGTGVAIIKWMGDGAMLAGDDSLAVLGCIYESMLSIRRSGPLPLRAGMTVGTVFRPPGEEVDYLGAAVNRAARLCAAAAPWQARVETREGDHQLYFTLRPAQR